VETEIERLVEALKAGVLVEDIRREIEQAEARRATLRAELAQAERRGDLSALKSLPATLSQIVSGLRGLAEKGRVNSVRSVLTRVVERIEVTGERVEGRKRPVPILLLRGDLRAALRLAAEKSTRGHSGGRIGRLRETARPTLDVAVTL